MTIQERIKYAEEKRDEAFSDGSIHNLTYWNGYIDALKKVLDDGASIIVNNFGKECKRITNEGHMTINIGGKNESNKG